MAANSVQFDVAIDRVRSRAQLGRFVTLPRLLYDGMPGYVPPLDHERYQLLDPRKSPFFTHGYAAYWIARRGGRAVGRVSAQIDLAAQGPDADAVGMFGCLDAIDDSEVVGALLGTAEDWLRRHGRRIARGPFLLSINGETGLLIEGQMRPPMTLMPWHPPYLADRVRAAGYALAMTVRGYDLAFDQAGRDPRAEHIDEVRARAQITVRNLRRRELRSELEQARQIFNDGWRGNWGFTPITETDVRSLGDEFRPLLYPELVFFIDVAGEPAAFFLAVPNLFELTAGLGPSPSIIGWAKFVLRLLRPRYRTPRLTFFGIKSKYQRSYLGGAIFAVVIDEIRRRGRALGLNDLHAGWVLESNRPILKGLQANGARPAGSYGIYEKHLTD